MYPYLYHTTDPANWDGIRRHGLLSTSRILSLYGKSDAERDAFVRRRRQECEYLVHSDLGVAVITDNKPLIESKLAACLVNGITPADWCAKLNDRVFFWPDEGSLHTLLN